MELPDNYRVVKSSINSSPGYGGFDPKRDDTVKKERVGVEELFRNIMKAAEQENKENTFVNALYGNLAPKRATASEDSYCVEEQFQSLERALFSTTIRLLGSVKDDDVTLVNMIVGLVRAIGVLQEAKERVGII